MNQTALTSRILALARPLLLLLLALTAFRAMALGPEWWTTQNVLTVGTPADDYAAINQGQLKSLVSGAVAAMDSSWPEEGAGYDLHDLVQSWLTPTNQTDDYAAVTLGQLKAVSVPVYDRLISVGLATAYPWNTANTPAPDDYALANIGQAKALFAFDLNGTQTHHLPASWLACYPMSGTGTGPDDDFDGDGLSNYWEYLHGKDPRDFYNGQTPTLQLVSGGGQWGAPGEVLDQPITVSVNNGASNAPVTFTVSSGGALLSQNGNPPWVNSLSVRSSSGSSPKVAQAYIKLSAAASNVSNFTVKAGSGYKTAIVQTTATTYDTSVPMPTAVQVVTLSQSELQLSWIPGDATRATSIEISKDNGATWQLYDVADPGLNSFQIRGLSAGQRVLLRLVTGDERKAGIQTSSSLDVWEWLKGYAGLWGRVLDVAGDYSSLAHAVTASTPELFSPPTAPPVTGTTVGGLVIEEFEKSFGYSYYYWSGWAQPISFYGYVDVYGYDLSFIHGWTNVLTIPPYDHNDRRSETVNKFNTVSFDDYLAGGDVVDHTWPVSCQRSFYSSNNGAVENAGGNAIELRVQPDPNGVPASGGNSTEIVDSCTYLVLGEKAEGPAAGWGNGHPDYTSDKMGTLSFVKYMDGHTTITYAGNLPGGAVNVNAAAQTVTIIPYTLPGSIWATRVRLAPVEVEQPKINADGTAGSLEKVGAVRLCRWASQRLASDSDRVDRAQFPSSDPDRIIIRLPLASNDNTVTVKISTTWSGTSDAINYDDAGAEMEFKKDPNYPSDFVSEPIVIVSDQDDDKLAVGPGLPADNAKGDRTFIGKPGGKIKLEGGGLSAPVEIRILPYTNKIKVVNVVLEMLPSDYGTSYLENRRRLQEIYAQNHIRAEIQPTIFTTDAQQRVAGLNFGSYVTPLNFTDLVSFVDSKVDDRNTIKLIWLPLPLVFETLGEPTADFAWNMVNYPSISRPDIILMHSHRLNTDDPTAQRTGHVAAHEVGHSLGFAISPPNDAHLQPSGSPYPGYHVMARGTLSYFIKFADPDRSSKHWFLIDGSKIKTNSTYCPPIAP